MNILTAGGPSPNVRTQIEAISDEPCRYREWDSRFFEQRIGEVISHRLSCEGAAGVLAWCTERAIDCLYFLADADDAETVRTAEANGFCLVDVRVTFVRSIADIARSQGNGFTGVRPAVSSDLSPVNP